MSRYDGMHEDLEYLVKNKYFDYEGFMQALTEREAAMGFEFVKKLVLNILNDAAIDWNYVEGEFLHKIQEMIPDLSKDFINKFLNFERSE